MKKVKSGVKYNHYKDNHELKLGQKDLSLM